MVIDAQTPLDELCRVDVTDSSDGELTELMVMARRLASRAQAVELAAVAEPAMPKTSHAVSARFPHVNISMTRSPRR